MRTSSLLTMALVPAALIAQAPASLGFSERLKIEGPAVEQLLKELQPQEALAKAEAMLPATKPEFNKTDVNKGRSSSFQFSDLARTYHLAGKAAVAAGCWEKGLEYFTKAQEIAKINVEQTTEVLTPAIEGWKKPVDDAKAALETGAARLAELSAKQPLTPEEDGELKNFQIHKQNIANGEKITKLLAQDIAATKTEFAAFQPMIDGCSKTIADEKTEMDKEIASTKFKGSREKYLVAVLNIKNLDARANKGDKLNFLNRLMFHCKNTPQAEKVKAVIGHIRLGEDPFPVEKKAPKKHKK